MVEMSERTRELLNDTLYTIQDFEENGEEIYPKYSDRLKAFRSLNGSELKVVILGQDPYHTPGMATGLAFDNHRHQKSVSPSLRNILDEILSDDLKNMAPYNRADSYLSHLPPQGVLLLNTALTVQKGEPMSHTKLWAPFTESLIADINKKNDIVWILWGRHAQSYKKFITNPTHKIIEGVHPSPLSAKRGFFGSKPFSKCNEYLEQMGCTPVNW